MVGRGNALLWMKSPGFCRMTSTYLLGWILIAPPVRDKSIIRFQWFKALRKSEWIPLADSDDEVILFLFWLWHIPLAHTRPKPMTMPGFLPLCGAAGAWYTALNAGTPACQQRVLLKRNSEFRCTSISRAIASIRSRSSVVKKCGSGVGVL